METGRKQKILYLITKSNFGGAQRYVFDLATNFHEHYDVAVAFGGHGLLETKLQEKGVRTIPLPLLERDINPFLDFTVFLLIFKLLVRERPNVVHLNSSKIGGLGSLAVRMYNFVFAPLHWISKRPWRARAVFTVHGWPWNEERPFMQTCLIYISSWATAVFAHRLIVIASTEKEQAARLPLIPDRKIVLVRNGAAEGALKNREEARAALKELGMPIEPNTFLVGSIAELHKNKGLEYAVEAMKIVKDTLPYARLVIMGSGEEHERLENLAIEHGVEKMVAFAGFVKDAALLIKAFDAFLLSSIKEGLPYVILEAGLAERPVIATKVGGMADVIQNGSTGILIFPRRIKEIANAIIYLDSHRQEGTEMAKNLSHLIRTSFSIERMVEETKKVYGM